MMRALCLLIIVLTLFSCSENESEKKETSFNKMEELVNELEAPDEINNLGKETEKIFTAYYDIFSATLKSKNYPVLNGFIHPEYGCYIIESGGALPSLIKVYDFSKYKNQHNKSTFFDRAFIKANQQLEYDSLPKVICDKEVYDRQGCFAQEVNPLLESQIWNYVGFNQKEIHVIESTAKTVGMTVVNTSNYTYYFSKIEGKWHITFVDLRVPCSA